MLSEVFLGRFLLSRSVEVLWNAKWAHANLVGEPAHDVLCRSSEVFRKSNKSEQ